MAVTLNNNTDCCESTCTNTTVNVAGPQGPAGAAGSNGTNGSNGVNAYAKTTSGFTVPSVGANVALAVNNATPWANGMVIFIQVAGYYEVVGTTGGTINAKNLGYTGNAAVGQSIATDRLIVSAGIQGVAGSGGITYPAGFAHKGDLLTHDGSTYTDQSIGSANTQALFVDSTAGNGMTWRQPKFADFNAATDKLNLATHTDTSTQMALTQIGNAGGGAGDLAYWDGTNWVRIPAGIGGQRLVFDTTLGRPKWSSAGGVEVIAKSNVIITSVAGGGVITTTITQSGEVNVGNYTKTLNSGAYTLKFAFVEDLAATQPTVLISKGNVNASDIYVNSIVTSGASRGITFDMPSAVFSSAIITEFDFVLLD